MSDQPASGAVRISEAILHITIIVYMLGFFKNGGNHESHEAKHKYDPGFIGLVMTVPFCMKQEFAGDSQAIAATYDALRERFASAKKMVRIFVPYADAAITALVSGARAQIMVVTTNRAGRCKGSPVLERMKLSHDILVRYLTEKRKGNSIFQVHAKLFIFDDSFAYVGSSNLTDTSLHYNLELGVMITQSDFIRRCSSIFDAIFEKYAVPLELL